MSPRNVNDPITINEVQVGSYSLETLTTGMYENPFHCIREYVQNAYDAIRAARASGILAPDTGLVTVSISGSASRPTLSVKDDGEGIRSAEAISTLVSVGASKKRSNVNAGFRGIGRLAGIAYCATLRFTTTARGEATATIVEFDCGRMRGYMRPGAEAQDVKEVIKLCVRTGTTSAKEDDHSTEVEMVGLTGIGLEFVEIERLVPYLRQVCPADYSDRFGQAPRIRTFADSLGHPIGAVEVETKYKRERTQILKAYDDVSPTSDPKKPSAIADIELITSAELGWHGWIGKSNFKGEITDDMVAGVRFRIKNIQVGGSEIIEDLGAELTTGGTEGRLQRWAVGEIFITNPSVVPNARRDGFEDGAAWRDIRKDVKARVARRVVTLVRAASTSRKTLKSIASEISTVALSLNRDSIDDATSDKIAATIDRLLSRLRPDKLSGGDPNEIGEQTSKLKSLKDKLVELKSRPPKTDKTQGADVAKPDDEVAGGDSSDNGRGDQDGGGGEDNHGNDWSAEEILEALRRVMVQELGQAEADRLFGIAYELLENGD